MLDFTDLKAFLDSLIPFGVPGFDCSVRLGYEEVFRYHLGYADREKQAEIAPNTIYRLYSCSKLITCATALQLLEKGKFLMTDYLDEYLPEYRHMKVLTTLPNGEIVEKEAARRIQILDLFRMSSGMDYDAADPVFQEERKKLPADASTLAIIRAMGKKRLIFEPGTRWRYSLSHDILAGVISELTGKSVQEAMKDAIFEPLGMENTFFFPKPEQEEKIAAEYHYDSETRYATRVETPRNIGDLLSTRFESGGGGLYSTLDDYAAFLTALANQGVGANGRCILSPCTIRLMKTDILTEDMRQDFNWNHTKGYGYGYGCRTMAFPGMGGSLSPAGEFGWAGATGAFALMDTDAKLSVCYMEQMSNSQEPYIHPRIRNLVYAALGK